MAQLTLREWNARQPLQLSEEQVRRDIRDGKIYPPPVKYGRSYLIEEEATRINIKAPLAAPYKSRLAQRIRDGRTAKKSQN